MISRNTHPYQNLFPATLVPVIRNVLKSDRFSASIVPLLEDTRDSEAAAILDTDEFAQWSGYRFPKRRNEYLTGRLAAKIALTSLVSQSRDHSFSYPEISIANHKGGQPYISSPETDLEISVSHSGRFGAALVAPVACGIDIQESEDKLVKLRSHFSFPYETGMLLNIYPEGGTVEHLNLLWSSREAIRKTTSRHGIPGFLEMRLTAATLPAAGVFMLTFGIDRDTAPAEINTYAMLLAGSPSYVVAVAFNQGSHHA